MFSEVWMPQCSAVRLVLCCQAPCYNAEWSTNINYEKQQMITSVQSVTKWVNCSALIMWKFLWWILHIFLWIAEICAQAPLCLGYFFFFFGWCKWISVVPWGIVSPCYTASGTREINGPGLSKASGLLLCSTITSNVLSSSACSAVDNGVFEEEKMLKQREEMWFMWRQWMG